MDIGPHSLMDRMRDCGSCDRGSIPREGTNTKISPITR